jgi:hypothetical protein
VEADGQWLDEGPVRHAQTFGQAEGAPGVDSREGRESSPKRSHGRAEHKLTPPAWFTGATANARHAGDPIAYLQIFDGGTDFHDFSRVLVSHAPPFGVVERAARSHGHVATAYTTTGYLDDDITGFRSGIGDFLNRYRKSGPLIGCYPHPASPVCCSSAEALNRLSWRCLSYGSVADSITLPLQIDDIDARWLTASLSSRVRGLKVNDFQIVDIIHGTATKIRIHLDLNEAGHNAGIGPTVIIKGGFEPHSRDMAMTYEFEGRGYRDVWPVLGLNTPTCYFAEIDPERAQTIVIMEDLVAGGSTSATHSSPRRTSKSGAGSRVWRNCTPKPGTVRTCSQEAAGAICLMGQSCTAATWNRPDTSSPKRGIALSGYHVGRRRPFGSTTSDGPARRW